MVIDLTRLGPNLPSQLIEIIKSSNWIKTGVGIDMDITYLSDNFNLSQCSRHIDLKTFCLASGCATPNLEYINSVLEHDNFQKKSTNSLNDWTQPLTINQLKYAESNAIVNNELNINYEFTHAFVKRIIL